MNRSERILGQIRIRTKQLGLPDYQDYYLYDLCNLVQNDIMLKTKCVEKEFQITTTSGIEYYDFEDEASVNVKFIISPYSDTDIELVPNYKYKELIEQDLGESGNPAYATIFNKQIFFFPVPTATDTIKVWCYQTSVIDLMGEDSNEPEVPQMCDNAVIFGVIAQMGNPEYMVLYQEQINTILANTIKHNRPKQAEARW